MSGVVRCQDGGGPDYFIDSHPFHRKKKIHFNKVRHAALLQNGIFYEVVIAVSVVYNRDRCHFIILRYAAFL